MGGKGTSLPVEIWQMAMEMNFEIATRAVMHRLNCQKSAEAIIPLLVGEGLNIKRFRKLDGFERNAEKADNFI
jgi:hypothetical protein